MPDSPETQRPRIIIPGAEPDVAPRIVLPGGGEASEPDRSAGEGAEPGAGAIGARGGIVLPPGVARDTPEDLPEYPRLRPLVLMPVSDGQRELLLVSDPLGVLDQPAVLSMEALPLLQLLDGTVSMADLTTLLMRENKDLRLAGIVRDFIGQLDTMLLLDSPRFERAFRALRDAYHPLEIRPAALEGRSYPADPGELRHTLDAHAAEAATLGEPPPPASPAKPPRALMAPHLDPRRAGATIARAMLELPAAPAAPLRVVVFGTGHSLLGDLFALTRKHFETPLGRVTCDTAFVDHVAARLGDLAYHGELAHRDEHSIEFQAIYLKHRLGDRPFTLVPILCGGFHALVEDGITPREAPEFEALIEAVRDAERTLGGDTTYVAGVDFSHIGPRFGDPAPDDRVRQETEAKDRAALAAALAGDADAWYQAIASHEDSTRICGFAPTYAMLRCADVRGGRLLHYAPSTEPDGTIVSIAAAAWD